MIELKNSEFDGTVESTFLGFHPVNIQVHWSKEEIIARHMVSISGDILYYNTSFCASPDRDDLALIVRYGVVFLLSLASFLLQLSMFVPFWRMATTRGPAFYILFNLVE